MAQIVNNGTSLHISQDFTIMEFKFNIYLMTIANRYTRQEILNKRYNSIIH